jgi:hypothetical protein
MVKAREESVWIRRAERQTKPDEELVRMTHTRLGDYPVTDAISLV